MQLMVTPNPPKSRRKKKKGKARRRFSAAQIRAQRAFAAMARRRSKKAKTSTTTRRRKRRSRTAGAVVALARSPRMARRRRSVRRRSSRRRASGSPRGFLGLPRDLPVTVAAGVGGVVASKWIVGKILERVAPGSFLAGNNGSAMVKAAVGIGLYMGLKRVHRGAAYGAALGVLMDAGMTIYNGFRQQSDAAALNGYLPGAGMYGYLPGQGVYGVEDGMGSMYDANYAYQ